MSGGGVKARAFWIVADQAISSLANAGLTVVLARAVSPGEYGAFALAFSVYSLVVALARAVAGEVVVIRYSAEDEATHVRAGAAAGGGAVLLGAVAAAVTVVVALFSGTPLREVLLTVGLLLPALVLQDTWRTVFISRGAPKQAFVSDTLWIVLQAAGIAVLLLLGIETVFPFVAVWGGAAVVAALYGFRQNGAPPSFRTARRWYADHREVSVPLLAESIATLGSTQIAFVLIATLGAVEDVGALRAAQTLLGPLNIIGFAAASFAVPEIVRRRLDRSGLFKAALALSALIVVVDVAWGAVLLLLPDSVGELLLGDTWVNARAVLPWMVLFTVLIGTTVGASAVMRALNRANLSFRVSVIEGPLVVLLSVIGVSVAGGPGAAAGFAAGAGLVILPCWLLMAHAVRLGRRDAPVTEDEPEDRSPDPAQPVGPAPQA